MCVLRRPLCLQPEDFINKFKITKNQFVTWVSTCENIVVRTRELNYMAQGLIFLHKILNNVSVAELAVDFVLTKRSVRKVFWNVAMHQYNFNSNIPRLVFSGVTVDAQVNLLLSESFSSTPALIQNIFRFFVDPSGRGRLPVLLLLDATYLTVQDSSDIFLHKTLFYGPKKDHIVKLICITNTIAKIVGILPLASSQSPTCGDSFLIGHFIELEEASGGAQYFRTLIRGNNTYYVILVTDAGLVTRPARAGVSVISLQDVCQQENCILLHTKTGDYLLERDAVTGTISKVPTRPELQTRQAHSQLVSRLVRNINEQAHGGLKQKVGLLGADKIPRQYLLPVGARLGNKHNLPLDDHKLPRLSILATLGVSLYNLIHAGFPIKFIDRSSQIALAQIYCSRINLENPFDHNPKWQCALDTNRSTGYQSVRIGNLPGVNHLGFPQLPQNLFNPLVFDLTGGPGPLLGASAILSYMCFRWLKETHPQFTVQEVQNSIGIPLESVLQFFVQEVEPIGWDRDMYGDFTRCTLIRMKCPPSHNSDSDQSKWKFAVVCFSDRSDNRLGIRGPLSQVLCWTCSRCPSQMGLMRTCKHVAALLMVLSFQYAFIPRTLTTCLLNPKASAGTQTTRILPESNAGGWSAQSLGSERVSRDTRGNNLMYQTPSSQQQSCPPPSPGAPQRGPFSTSRASPPLPAEGLSHSSSFPQAPSRSPPPTNSPARPGSYPQQSSTQGTSGGLSASPGCPTALPPTPRHFSSPTRSPAQWGSLPTMSSPQPFDSFLPDQPYSPPTSIPGRGQSPSPPSFPGQPPAPTSLPGEHPFSPTSLPGEHPFSPTSLHGQTPSPTTSLPGQPPSPPSFQDQASSTVFESQELSSLIRIVDPNNNFPLPTRIAMATNTQFSYTDLQQHGLVNDGCSCYMISIILLLHRVRILDQMLDSEYCSIAVSRNEGKSFITNMLRRILQVLPSSQPFSPRNLIAGWEYVGLQPGIQVGGYEDAQEVLATVLSQLLLKVPRSQSDKLFTKFQARLLCQKTRDCQNALLADFYVGQSDISPFIHVIGLHQEGDEPVKVREKLQQFCSSSFDSRCQAIMCRKKIRNAEIHVSPGRFTLVSFNRSNMNQSKMMNKLDMTFYHPEVNYFCQEPIAVISHGGSLASGHYVVYTKVEGRWYLNNDSKQLSAASSPFNQNSIHGETADILVFENK